MKEVQVHDWAERLIDNLLDFQDYWHKEHEANPTAFPLYLMEGDLQERFNMYVEQQSKKENEVK